MSPYPLLRNALDRFKFFGSKSKVIVNHQIIYNITICNILAMLFSELLEKSLNFFESLTHF